MTVGEKNIGYIFVADWCIFDRNGMENTKALMIFY